MRVVGANRDPRGRLGFLLKRFEVGLRLRLDERLRELGLTTNQYATLATLSRVDGMSTAELARYFRVSPQAMSQLVTALERRGMVTRRADEQHHKIMRLSLTPLGKRRQLEADAAVTEIEDGLVENLSAPERNVLFSTLEKCCETLDMLDDVP
ncbi:MAG: MarR family transcriptional regulator [Pseudonocardiaceae bacterium]|nr:MarR family transcriptional regulator [Pseudonocardiaceae bacterium]